MVPEGFARFDNGDKTKKTRAAIWTRGSIVVKQHAVEEYGLQEKKHAVLFYNEANKQIGIYFTDTKESGSIKIADRQNGFIIRAKVFLAKYGLMHEKSKQYDLWPDAESDLYIISLGDDDMSDDDDNIDDTEYDETDDVLPDGVEADNAEAEYDDVDNERMPF